MDSFTFELFCIVSIEKYFYRKNCRTTYLAYVHHIKVELKEFTSTILNEGKIRDQNKIMRGFKKEKIVPTESKILYSEKTNLY